MKKLFLFCVANVLSFGYVFAQDDAKPASDINIGVTAGFLSVTEKAKAESEGLSYSQSDSGFYVGLLAEFELSDKLNLQPELLYANVAETSLIYVPLQLEYFVTDKLFLLGGPQATIFLDDVPQGINEFGLDLFFGIGFDIDENFFLEGRYAFELTNRVNTDLDITDRINSLMIGIGYKF